MVSNHPSSRRFLGTGVGTDPGADRPRVLTKTTGNPGEPGESLATLRGVPSKGGLDPVCAEAVACATRSDTGRHRVVNPDAGEELHRVAVRRIFLDAFADYANQLARRKTFSLCHSRADALGRRPGEAVR